MKFLPLQFFININCQPNVIIFWNIIENNKFENIDNATDFCNIYTEALDWALIITVDINYVKGKAILKVEIFI